MCILVNCIVSNEQEHKNSMHNWSTLNDSLLVSIGSMTLHRKNNMFKILIAKIVFSNKQLFFLMFIFLKKIIYYFLIY